MGPRGETRPKLIRRAEERAAAATIAAMSAPQDLRSFLDELRGADELIEIEAEVSPDLELAEIHRRVIAAGGPALLFSVRTVALL